jgi:hypothetical protein
LSRKMIILAITLAVVITAGVVLTKKKSESNIIDPNGSRSLSIIQHSGKVLIEEWDRKGIKVSFSTKKKTNTLPYKTVKKDHLVEIQSTSNKDTDLHILIPKTINTITANVTASGNIKVKAKEPVSLNLNSVTGNIVADLGAINKNSKINILTNYGQVYVSVPKDSKVATISGPLAPNLVDVQKSSDGASMKLTQVSDLPVIVGRNPDKSVQASSTPQNDTLTPEMMNEDIMFLAEKLKTENSIFMNNPEKYQPFIDRALKQTSQPTDIDHFYFILSEMLTHLHDGHTTVYPVIKDYIPIFNAYWSDTGLLVTEKTNDLKPGDKILSIGGVKTDDLLNKLVPYTPAEHMGWVKAKATTILPTGAFLRYFHLIGQDHKVELKVENNGKVRSVLLSLKEFEQKQQPSEKELYENPPHPFFSSKLMKEQDLAIFRLDQCIYSKYLGDAVTNFFNQVKKSGIHNVAIDLRWNSGGSDSVIDFFQENIDRLGLKKDHLFIYSSGNTFSAATDAVLHFKYVYPATIIGMPPGNVPMYGGNVEYMQLPNSKIGFQYSTTYGANGGPEELWLKPIQPDIKAEYTAEDLKNEKDPWIEATENAIR